MKRLINIIFSFVVFCSFSKAQKVAGYQGKRWIVNYDLSFSPAITYLVRSGDEYAEINALNSLSTEYVHQLRRTLYFGAKYYQTKVFFGTPLRYYYKENNNNYLTQSSFIPDTFAQIRAVELNAGIKFHTWLLAPLGICSLFDFGYIFYSVAASPYMFVIKEKDFNAEITYQPEIHTNKNYSAMKIGYTISKQRIIFDKILINAGLNTGWVIGGQKLNLKRIFNLSENKFSLKEHEYIEITSKNRLWGLNLLNFKLGIGFLAH